MGFWSKARAFFTRRAGPSKASPATGACDHHGSTLEEGTPEFELEIAKAELESGNLPHGAHHLANLISFDPTNREWLDLLDEYLRRVNGDEGKLYPINAERYFAQEAIRAYAWACKGKFDEAIGLLLQVVQAKLDSTYIEAWVVDWLAQPNALASLSQQNLEHIFALALSRFPESGDLKPKQRAHLERFAELAARVPADKQNTAVMQMTRAGLLRKAGRLNDALKVAQAAIRTLPNWHTYGAEGLILRAQGNCEAAAASFERALFFDSDDLSVRLEAADGFLTHHVWDKALAWYGQVLEREPSHAWAMPSVLYCEWKTSGDPAKRQQLINLARANPPNQRAAQLLRWHDPYVGYLPGPADATANVLRQLTKSFRNKPPENGDNITVTVSHLESPSATLAIEEQLKAFGVAATVTVNVEAVQDPDPRLPCQSVKHALWRYKGTTATPALSAPPLAMARAVNELALTQYDYDEHWQHAKRLAGRFGDNDVPHFLAAMVNPPPIPAGKESIEWLPRVQLAAAQIIANIGKTWIGSARRDGLYSALLGPRDWTTNAAIIALGRLGADDEEIASDIRSAFRMLQSVITDSGYCCFAHALFSNWQFLAGLPPEETQRVRERLLELEDD